MASRHTKETIDQAKSMWVGGSKQTEVSKELGVSIKTISSWVKQWEDHYVGQTGVLTFKSRKIKPIRVSITKRYPVDNSYNLRVLGYVK